MMLMLLLAVTGTYAQADKDAVKFTAKIENRNTDSIVINGAAKFRKVIKLDKKGLFSDAFTAPAGLYQFTDGVEYTSLYLKPGFDLSMTMNAKLFDESIVYKGKGEKENNFLAQKALIDEGFGDEMASLQDEKAFAAAFAVRNKKLNDKLNDPKIDPDFKALAVKMLAQENGQIEGEYKQAQTVKKLAGNASPGFEYENFKGGKTKLEEFRGKYVYIDVWATWCGPCRAEIPFLQKIEEKYKGKNIEFISLSVDEAKNYDKWKTMVKDKQLGGVQVIADNNWTSSFITAYGINSIPRFILIDPKGNVVDANAKRPSEAALQTQLDALLK